MTDAAAAPPVPQPAELDFSDLKEALAKGFHDFRMAPSYGVVFSLLFTLLGVVAYLQMTVWQTDWSIVPIAAGFPLVGPFVAVGMYEVSRILGSGQKPTWTAVLQAIYNERRRQVPSIAFVVLFIFLVWVYLAHLVFALSFGTTSLTNVMSSVDILYSSEGITMLVMGSIVGAILSFLLFSITVVGIPILVDKEVDVVTAMISSVNLVRSNLIIMGVWGVIVAVLLLIAMIPLFFGLLLILPVLGHATWHLYKLSIYYE